MYEVKGINVMTGRENGCLQEPVFLLERSGWGRRKSTALKRRRVYQGVAWTMTGMRRLTSCVSGDGADGGAGKKSAEIAYGGGSRKAGQHMAGNDLQRNFHCYRKNLLEYKHKFCYHIVQTDDWGREK